MRKNDIEKDVVFFATDSICTNKKLDVNSIKLGDFSFDNEATYVFVLQNGFYRFNGKWKQRELGKLNGKEIEHLETFEKDGRLISWFKTIFLRNCFSKFSKINSTYNWFFFRQNLHWATYCFKQFQLRFLLCRNDLFSKIFLFGLFLNVSYCQIRYFVVVRESIIPFIKLTGFPNVSVNTRLRLF